MAKETLKQRVVRLCTLVKTEMDARDYYEQQGSSKSPQLMDFLKAICANQPYPVAIIRNGDCLFFDEDSGGNFYTFSMSLGGETDMSCLISSGDKPVVLLNADEDANYLISDFDTDNPAPAPTISFNCLNFFFKKSDNAENVSGASFGAHRDATPYICEFFAAAQRMEVLDFHLDKFEKMTKDDYKQYIRRHKRPAAGRNYVKVNGKGWCWHTPSQVLVKFDGRRAVFGLDEGQYFCAVLPLDSQASTVVEAFEELKPLEARGRTDWLRQGEWFAIPADPQLKVEALENLVMPSDDDILCLPYEVGGNPHRLTANEENVRVTTQGVFMRDGSLTHDQHADLNIPPKQWYTFRKNTAIENYSAGGVD